MSTPVKSILGLGNPLLDFQVPATQELLQRYGLKENDAIPATMVHNQLFKEITEAEHGAHLTPGGATQNTLRALKYSSTKSTKVTMIGAVGTDAYATTMKNHAERDGLHVIYQQHPGYETGICIALLYKHNRSLICRVGAAQKFTVEFLVEAESVTALKEAELYYSSGFFLASCPLAFKRIGELAARENKCFASNLAAPYISRNEEMHKCLRYMDILFANEEEAREYARTEGWSIQDIGEIAAKISCVPKDNKNRTRTVIVTRAAKEVIVANPTSVQSYAVPPVPEKEMVDTNGAGDAFAGGYLAEHLRGGTPEECVRSGNHTAGVVVRQHGCTFPKKLGA